MTTLNISMADTIEQLSYKILSQQEPKLLITVKQLLAKGQTPREITKFVESRDVFLAGIVEMAIVHMQKETASETD